MRVLLVGNSEQIDRFAGAAADTELAVERWREDEPVEGGEEAVAAIAASLRQFEAALTGAEQPDAVVAASDSSAALAAVIVATKVGTPVAALADQGARPEGTNARLIRQLADRELAPEPAAIVDWVRGTYTQRA
jgi:UDP-N-acetylglucosamine 2-epimerase